MTTRTIRMNVPVSTLLTNAKARRDSMIEEYEDAMGDYKIACRIFQDQALGALTAAYSQIQQQGWTSMGWAHSWKKGEYVDSIQVPVTEKPVKPELPSETEIDADIALLSATTDTYLSLTIEDRFAKYLQSRPS